MRKIIGFAPFSGLCVIALLLLIPDLPDGSYSKLTFSLELSRLFLFMLVCYGACYFAYHHEINKK